MSNALLQAHPRLRRRLRWTPLGTFPTPVEYLTELDLWVKRDDRSGALYGGNKVRKLEFLLADAVGRGAHRIVTLSAFGSHHLLATTLYGRGAGLEGAARERFNAIQAELAEVSSQIDKQELRKFYFSAFSVLVLAAILSLLFFQSPRGRDWLPQETDTILSINAEQFEHASLAKRWRDQQPKLWPGLIGPAASVPGLNPSRDAARITRALTTGERGERREFNLVQTRRSLAKVIRTIADDKTFQKRSISGLPVWQRQIVPAQTAAEQSDFAVARVGPATLAVGAPEEVDELVLVRLGMKPDLKITGQLIDRFQALDRDSPLRLISRDPADLSRVFHPIFPSELLEASQLIGLAVNLQNPVKARILIKVNTPKRAGEVLNALRTNPQQWLRLPGSQLLLYSQLPDIQMQGDTNLELRFTVPEDSARLLVERLAGIDVSESAVATH